MAMPDSSGFQGDMPNGGEVGGVPPPPIERFCINMNSMGELTSELLQKAANRGCQIVDPTLVVLGMAVLESYDDTTLITRFIEHSHAECWDKIKARNEIFFENNIDSIFEGLPMGNVKAFEKLFKAQDTEGNHIIDREDREDIWSYMDSFVNICLDYIHHERWPDVIEKDGNRTPIYRRKYMDEVDLRRHCNNWDYKREFWPRSSS